MAPVADDYVPARGKEEPGDCLSGNSCSHDSGGFCHVDSLWMGNGMFRRRCRSRDWFRCTSEPHPRQGDSSSHPRCDSPGRAVWPETGRVSSHHIPGVICSALPEERPGCTVASKAITDPGTGHHGPFGRIDVLKGPDGRWCLHGPALSLTPRRQPGRSAHDAQASLGGARLVQRGVLCGCCGGWLSMSPVRQGSAPEVTPFA